MAFPRTVTLKQGGKVLHSETRSRVRANVSADADRFAFPSGVRATYDLSLASRGARTTEWLMTFAQLGFIKDGTAKQIVPRLIAPRNTSSRASPTSR